MTNTTNMTHPDIKPSKIQFEPSSCSTMTHMIRSEPLITKDLIDALLNRVNEKLEISLNVSDFDQYTISSGNPPGEDDLSDRKILSMAKEKAGDGNHVGSYKQRLRIDAKRNRNGDLKPPPGQPGSVERALPTLISLLPSISECSFDGPLYQNHLSNLIRISHLKQLRFKNKRLVS